MGLCCRESSAKKEVSKQFKESICKIKSRNRLKGIGFFVTIHFPENYKVMNVLITSNKLIDKYDLTNENNIQLYLKNSNSIINLNINNNRKFYSDDKYQISIIELLENDVLKDIVFLNAVYYLNIPKTFYNIESIFLLFFNNNSNNTLNDQYISGNIIIFLILIIFSRLIHL